MIDQEVFQGLNSHEKSISSKFFYDEVGGEIFQKITQLPEYYLTRVEYAILEEFCEELKNLFSNEKMAMVELGSGASDKTLLLVDAFEHCFDEFYFCPLDVDITRLKELEANIHEIFPKLKIKLLEGDFFKTLDKAFEEITIPKIITFLGSSIGNFNSDDATELMRNVSSSMTQKDFFLVGFDMVKDERILNRAYNDSLGLTRSFNLNLLERFNRECGCDFNLSNFEHKEFFNEKLSAMESYLISLKEQTVNFPALDEKIHFKQNEKIHTEYSFKYTLEMIDSLAEKANLKIKKIFSDEKSYFTSVLFTKT